MITFKVDNVQKGHPVEEDKYLNSKSNLKSLVGLGVEAFSLKEGQITFTSNNLMAAINTAYDRHLPLVLSPDMLWLAIAQGLSLHINNNAEELRHQFVDHEGKEKIEIFEDSFRKGSPDNDWSHAFMQFSDAIKGYIGKKRDLIVGEYSTTGPVEKAANEIVLMEAMQQYFSYECTTCCGIPEITLLGTVEDWKAIKTRVQAMSEFNLSWWTSKLEPIVDEFIAAASGNANKTFWQKIFKENGGSGGPYISGWSTHLFPYLKNWRDQSKFSLKNDFTADDSMFGGLTTGVLPTGLSKVPFIWNYFDTKFNMELAAGFTGHSYDESGAVIPSIGWTVRDTESCIKIKAKFGFPESVPMHDWRKQDEIKKGFISELEKLSFEIVDGKSWGKTLYGALPKDKFEEAQKIPGLSVKLWDENNNDISEDY